MRKSAHQTAPSDGLLKQFALDRSSRDSLVAQLVSTTEGLLSGGVLQPGDRMPSIRTLAGFHKISTFTVAEAYDRMVAADFLVAHRSSGYFVKPRGQRPATENYSKYWTKLIDKVQYPALSPDLYYADSGLVPLGAGWLPVNWYGSQCTQDAFRQILRSAADKVQGYGHILGWHELRSLLARKWQGTILGMDMRNVLLTRSATHAFDLILRTLTKPGDHVLIEDPGYPPLIHLVEHNRCIPVGIPRNKHGIDLDAFERIASTTSPRLAFITTVLHNPLGVTLSSSDAYRLLQIAEHFDFHIVEDDIFRELSVSGAPSIAAMDGLRRTIRVDSTSKTLSPFIRVGSIFASETVIAELTRIKMITGLTSPELDERIAYLAMVSGDYRRAVERIKTRLEIASSSGIARLQTLGLEPIAHPSGGMFIAAKLSAGRYAKPEMERRITEYAAKEGILLAPSVMFSRDTNDAPWFRFNVAHLDNPLVQRFFAQVSQTA